MKILFPEHLQGKELYKFLVENKKMLITQKKYGGLKHGDPFCMHQMYVDEKGEIVKALPAIGEDVSMIKAVVIINTTYWMDSHDDVHIDGLWKKSLAEYKALLHLQEHLMTFKGIITDEVKAYTKKYKWTDLNVAAEGNTEALVFESNIDKGRNTFMFNEYRLGRVKNHSVGMNYVQIELAINDEDYKEEFAVWNKYISDIANKHTAEAKGYFWAVKEAKAIEGSAVPVGSNRITPTQSIEPAKTHSTGKQPPEGTEEQPHTGVAKQVDWSKIADHLNN